MLTPLDGCDGPDLDGGRADVGLEDGRVRSEVAAGEDEANVAPETGLKQWMGGPCNLVVDMLHLSGVFTLGAR